MIIHEITNRIIPFITFFYKYNLNLILSLCRLLLYIPIFCIFFFTLNFIML